MSGKFLFGTDGIRGPFGEPPLDRDSLRRLGSVLGGHVGHGAILLAGDTRASTPDICRWIAEGLAAAETPYLYGGVLPTPAVARLVPALGMAAGIAVSASHNPYPDNGVKLIDAAGGKWAVEAERRLEEALALATTPVGVPEVGIVADETLGDSYLADLASAFPTEHPLRGLRVTLDCANGAASELAPRLFSRLGAGIEVLGDRPDGSNINLDCGSTSPRRMAEETARSDCHVGFAFDGDADRVVLADETGQIRDGDAILYLLGCRLRDQGNLDPARIVATTMSNIGLEVALAREGIALSRCDVGDRFVVEALRRQGLLLGGEQSGHIVHLGLGPTGDGLQTALLVAEALLASDQPLSSMLADFTVFPQVLRNVPVASKPAIASLPAVAEGASEIEKALAGRGRLLLRYSGTEPLLRIMIEGPDQDRIEAFAARLAAVIDAEIGNED